VRLFELTLQSLEVKQSKLGIAPRGFGQLVSLQRLVLSSCQLQGLPSSVFINSQKLESVDLSHNCLEVVPVSLGACGLLRVIDLGFNSLSSLPPALGNLPALETLILTENQLAELPGCSLSLSLSVLIVAGNQLKELPVELTTLARLTELDVAENQLSMLPEELASCARLKVVSIQGNSFSDKKLAKAATQGTKAIMQVLRGGSKGAVKQRQRKEKSPPPPPRRMHCEATRSILVEPSADCVRPYIFAVVLHVKDGISQDVLQGLIQVQNQLHSKDCKKRRLACLGSHCVSAVHWPLHLVAQDLAEVKIYPLKLEGEWQARDMLKALQDDPHYQLYAASVLSQQSCALLQDDQQQVLALYPVTNSKVTENKPGMTEILLEVTSTESSSVCEAIFQALLRDSVAVLDSAGLETSVEPVRIVSAATSRLRYTCPSQDQIAELD